MSVSNHWGASTQNFFKAAKVLKPPSRIRPICGCSFFIYAKVPIWRQTLLSCYSENLAIISGKFREGAVKCE